jgi:hypothetical protein
MSLVLGLAGFLAFVSFVSQIGFNKVPGFEVGPQLNVFGLKDTSSGRGYMDAVFGALLNPSAWRAFYRESLFHQIALPSLPILQNPQLVDQFRILLLVVPLIGAVLSAATYAQDVRRFVGTNVAPVDGELGGSRPSFERFAHRPPLRLLQLRHMTCALRTLVLPALTWARRNWLFVYAVMAVMTLPCQLWVRVGQCVGIENCGPSLAKGVIWSVIWPASWIVYLAGFLPQYLG